MERQKIFWVVLSVSVFMVLVLVVGVFLLRPRPAPAAAASGTQVYEYQRETPLASAPAGTSGSEGGSDTLHFYIGEGDQAGTTGTTTPGTGATGTGTTGTTSPAAATTPPTVTGTAAAASPAAGTTKTAAAPKAVPVAKPKTTKVTEYWIQTGSYKSQGKAEDLVALLSDKGLNGRVFSFASSGETWYRVRVGPYTSRGEADKFLAEVKKLQGLESSFIAQVAGTRTN